MWQSLLGGERLPYDFVEGGGDDALNVGDAEVLRFVGSRYRDRGKTGVSSYELFVDSINVLAFSKIRVLVSKGDVYIIIQFSKVSI